MTRTAEQLLRAGGIFEKGGHRLVARQARLAAELQEAILSCATCINQPEDRRPWRFLRVSTEGPRISAPTIEISAISWGTMTGNSVPATLVVVTDPKSKHADLRHKIASRFCLTRAEGNLVAALCEGTSVTQYAIARGISVQTARTLLKRAFGKTDTHSQAELVSLILKGGSLL
jgi:DNA-binding CsgD family transcriptional regulator